MLDFFNRTKGSVSIFLVLILLPMMTVGAIFVDAGKMSLVNSVADSASDLTLNTALTDYDTKLKDLYGLFATAQDTDELFEKLEDYYRTSITASGVNNDIAQTYTDQIMAQLGLLAQKESNSSADLLKMDLNYLSVEKNPNTTLANPAVLKVQIVDFMKYRSPINTGLSFIQSLKSFTSLDKQNDVVDKRMKYYEEEENVMSQLKAAWDNISQYNNTEVVSNSNFFSDMQKEFTDPAELKADFVNISRAMISDVLNIGENNLTLNYGTEDRSLSPKDIDGKKGSSVNVPSIYTESSSGKTYKNTYIDYYNNYNLKNLPENLPTANGMKILLGNFFDQYDKVVSYSFPLMDNYKDMLSSVYPIQYVAQNMRDYKFGDMVSNALIPAYDAYQKIKNAQIWIDAYDRVSSNTDDEGEEGEEGETETDDTDTITSKEDFLDQTITIKSKSQTISTFLSDAETKFQKLVDSIFPLVNQMHNFSKDIISGSDKYSDRISKIKNDSLKKLLYIENVMEQLTNASQNLGDAVSHLTQAAGLVDGNLKNARSNWQNSVDAVSGTAIAQQDSMEIAQSGKNLNSDEIRSLASRLTNTKTQIDKTINSLKEFSFDGKPLVDISTVSVASLDADKAFNSIRVVVDNYATQYIGRDIYPKTDSLGNALPVDNSALANLCDVEGSAYYWVSSSTFNVQWAKQTDTLPNLEELPGVTVGTNPTDRNGKARKVYNYLSSHFKATESSSGSSGSSESEQSKEDAEKLYDNIEKNDINNAESEAGSGGDLPGGEDGPFAQRDISSNKSLAVWPSLNNNQSYVKPVIPNGENAASDSSSNLKSMFSKLAENITNLAGDFRDKLYIADYAMSMFSYDTVQREYNKKNEEKGITVSGEDEYPHTLTMTPINAENNFMYGGEVEYIIYGSSNSNNKFSAYGSIYGVRLGLNLVYAFLSSEIRDTAFALATPISAATLGIIPVPLIQGVIIIALACCESAVDLDTLRKGESLPLYKDKDSWRCSPTGLVNVAKGVAKEVSKKVVDKAADVLTDGITDLLDMTDEELESFISEKSDQLSNTFREKYDSIITENINAVIQSVTTTVNTGFEKMRGYITDLSAMGEKEINSLLSSVKSELQNEKDAISGSDMASDIKRSAIDYILSHDDLLKDLINKVKESMGTSLNSIIDAGNSTANDFVAQVSSPLLKCVEDIRTKIEDYIKNTTLKINDKVKSTIEDLKEKVKNKSGDIKKQLNDKIDGLFGESKSPAGVVGGDTKTSFLSSVLSFRYSDYLRLFLMINLFTGEEGVLLRMADVIQSNMAWTTRNSQYALDRSAVYVDLTAKIHISPTLLALPLFDDVEGNPFGDGSGYVITVRDTKGY